jgi:hypothetical protein
VKVFEKRALRMIFGPKREEVREECRSFMLYSSPSIIRVIK